VRREGRERPASVPGGGEYTDRVKRIVAERLQVDRAEVTARARFVEDLGADPGRRAWRTN
jgi:hypothetical protein